MGINEFMNVFEEIANCLSTYATGIRYLWDSRRKRRMERRCERLEELLKEYVVALNDFHDGLKAQEAGVNRRRVDKLTDKVLSNYYALDVNDLKIHNSPWRVRLKIAFQDAMEASLAHNTWDRHMASVLKQALGEL